jgi:hypothetical protein
MFGVAAVLAVKLLGYYIFRGANGQKDTFRCLCAHFKTCLKCSNKLLGYYIFRGANGQIDTF